MVPCCCYTNHHWCTWHFLRRTIMPLRTFALKLRLPRKGQEGKYVIEGVPTDPNLGSKAAQRFKKAIVPVTNGYEGCLRIEISVKICCQRHAVSGSFRCSQLPEQYLLHAAHLWHAKRSPSSQCLHHRTPNGCPETCKDLFARGFPTTYVVARTTPREPSSLIS